MEKKSFDLEQVLIELKAIRERWNSLVPSLEEDYVALLKISNPGMGQLELDQYDRFQDEVKATWNSSLAITTFSHISQLATYAINVNVTFYLKFALFEKWDNRIEEKREIASELNAMLRVSGGAMVDREDDASPKILAVVASRDGEGRYAFEDRNTKKRSGSYKSIKELLPLRFMIDRPRESPKKPKTRHFDPPNS